LVAFVGNTLADALADAVAPAVGLDAVAVGEETAALETGALGVPALEAAAVEPAGGDALEAAGLDTDAFGWLDVHAESSKAPARPTDARLTGRAPMRTWEAVMVSSLPA
jgi:hypothetical protein